MQRRAIALIAALFIVPFAASAADDPSSKQQMKGPPNADGYGQEKMGDTVVKDEKAQPGKDMKGPPNADGYKKPQ